MDLPHPIPRLTSLVALALAACSPAPKGPPAPARVKLVELPGARLETAATNLGTEPLFTEEFTGGTGGWSVVSTPTDPTRQTEGALTHEVRSEGGESFLRLGGTRGLLIQLQGDAREQANQQGVPLTGADQAVPLGSPHDEGRQRSRLVRRVFPELAEQVADPLLDGGAGHVESAQVVADHVA